MSCPHAAPTRAAPAHEEHPISHTPGHDRPGSGTTPVGSDGAPSTTGTRSTGAPVTGDEAPGAHRADGPTHETEGSADRHRHPEHRDGASRAHRKFGGINPGAAIFGWLVAIAVTILAISLIGAVASAVGSSTEMTQTEAEQAAGTIGIVSAIVLVVAMTVGHFAGGYVAGRMSRFDGAKQGIGVWLVGIVVTVVAVVLGAVFGAQYNLLDRVALPRLPLSLESLGWGGIVTAVVVLATTAAAVIAGGKLGERYHHRVDDAIRS